jgi:hypothetical protein
VVDPKMQDKVQSRLRSTLSEAEELVAATAEKVVRKTLLFKESILSKCANGERKKKELSTPDVEVSA